MFSTEVSVKKRFIENILMNYVNGDLGRNFLLQNLMRNPSMLTRVHFVENINNYNHTMHLVIAATPDDSFRYKIHDAIYTNPIIAYKCFSQFLLDETTPDLYIKIEYFECDSCPLYREVVNQDFNAPKLTETAADQCFVEEFLTEQLERQLIEKIDEALDLKDRDTFISLTKELVKLTKEKAEA